MVDINADGRRIAALLFGLTEDQRAALADGDVQVGRFNIRMGARPHEVPPRADGVNVRVSFGGVGRVRAFAGEEEHHIWDVAVLANRWSVLADAVSHVLTAAETESLPVEPAIEVFDNKQYSVIVTVG